MVLSTLTPLRAQHNSRQHLGPTLLCGTITSSVESRREGQQVGSEQEYKCLATCCKTPQPCGTDNGSRAVHPFMPTLLSGGHGNLWSEAPSLSNSHVSPPSIPYTLRTSVQVQFHRCIGFAVGGEKRAFRTSGVGAPGAIPYARGLRGTGQLLSALTDLCGAASLWSPATLEKRPG